MHDEPISRHTDDQAVQDEMLRLVPDWPSSKPQPNRITFNAFAYLSSHLREAPPMNWPVHLRLYFTAENGGQRALAAAAGLIAERGARARQVWEENIGGGIYVLAVEERDGRIVALGRASAAASELAGEPVTLWLIPNEMGGLTLMFPEDY